MIDNYLKEEFDRITKCVPEISRLAGKNMLIAGGTGIIGGYLIRYIDYLNKTKFKDKPCSITSLSRKGEKNDFLKDVSENIKFIKHDISQPYEPLDKLNYILHSACDCAPLTFTNNPLEIISSQVDGLRNLLDIACDVESFMYVSTVEIYGHMPDHMVAITETYNGNTNPLSRRACYTESKRLGEAICDAYHKKYNIPIKIVRPQALYGMGYDYGDDRILPAFIERALTNGYVHLLDKGEDIRGFFYIADGIIPILKLLFSDYNMDPFNIAGDELTTIYLVADKIHKILGIEREVDVPNVKKYLPAAPKRVVIDNTKSKEKLGLKQHYSLDEGLKRTIDWLNR